MPAHSQVFGKTRNVCRPNPLSIQPMKNCSSTSQTKQQNSSSHYDTSRIKPTKLGQISSLKKIFNTEVIEQPQCEDEDP